METFNMFCNCKKEIAEMRKQIEDIRRYQTDFLDNATKIMRTVLDNDKREFAYELKQNDIGLMEDGEKYRSIIKIIK
jgi:hypothetical protein